MQYLRAKEHRWIGRWYQVGVTPAAVREQHRQPHWSKCNVKGDSARQHPPDGPLPTAVSADHPPPPTRTGGPNLDRPGTEHIPNSGGTAAPTRPAAGKGFQQEDGSRAGGAGVDRLGTKNAARYASLTRERGRKSMREIISAKRSRVLATATLTTVLVALVIVGPDAYGNHRSGTYPSSRGLSPSRGVLRLLRPVSRVRELQYLRAQRL